MEIKIPCSNSPLSELKKVEKHMAAKFLKIPCQTPPVNFALTGGVKITFALKIKQINIHTFVHISYSVFSLLAFCSVNSCNSSWHALNERTTIFDWDLVPLHRYSLP
jgi:hypothetical protein